jgi:hypothetical protein
MTNMVASNLLDFVSRMSILTTAIVCLHVFNAVLSDMISAYIRCYVRLYSHLICRGLVLYLCYYMCRLTVARQVSLVEL